MAANDGDANVPIQVEWVPDPSTDPAASRIPRAVAGAAIAPGAVAAFFAADGERSVYNDPAALRAGESGGTYTRAGTPGLEADFPASFDAGGADGGGE